MKIRSACYVLDNLFSILRRSIFSRAFCLKAIILEYPKSESHDMENIRGAKMSSKIKTRGDLCWKEVIHF
jgi:hypothetical protein